MPRFRQAEINFVTAAFFSCASILAQGAPLDCTNLQARIVAQENAAHAPHVHVVANAAVGQSKVLGSCGGGTMKVVLAENTSVALGFRATSKVAASSGALVPGSHEVLGPETCVTLTQWAVSVGQPACEGSVSKDDVLSAFSKADIPVIGSIPEWFDNQGWGVQRHQDFAECALVCAAVPARVAITDENTHILFDLNGQHATGGMAKIDEGRWGPGEQGYWRVDPGIMKKTVGDQQFVCKQARNWSATHSRLFRLVVDYRIGNSSRVNAREVDQHVVACRPH